MNPYDGIKKHLQGNASIFLHLYYSIFQPACQGEIPCAFVATICCSNNGTLFFAKIKLFAFNGKLCYNEFNEKIRSFSSILTQFVVADERGIS